MNMSKPWYLSKTVWGGLVAALLGIAGLFGIDIPADQAQTLTDVLMDLVVAASGAFAVFGRIVASSEIK